MALWTDILFPRRCILCEQLLLPEEEGPVCGECSLEAYWITGHRCRICSRPVQEEGGICVSCLMHGHTVPGFSLLYYRGAVRSSIHRFKYEDQRSYATGYAKLITERVGFKGAGCFVPIPIHKKRFRERGYNQAQELSEALSARTGIPVIPILRRVRNTSAQNKLSAAARRENVKGAFDIDPSVLGDEGLPAGKVIVIDDLYTSGATIEEAAAVIKSAYPEADVCFFTLAMRLPEKPLNSNSENEK